MYLDSDICGSPVPFKQDPHPVALYYMIHYSIYLLFVDVVTRLSPRCCEQMVAGNAVDVIYLLIRSCNRSLPHMELIKYSVNILLNLTKVSQSTHAIYIDQSSL